MRKLKILIACMAALCVGVFIASCGNDQGAKTSSSSKTNVIVIGNELPNLPVRNIGLGELTKAESSEVDTDANDTADSKKYVRTSKNVYKNQDGEKELHVQHYTNPDNSSLETFTKIKSFESNSGYNYRMGKSEVFSLANREIEDGYYVKCCTTASKVFYLCQQLTFSDGDEFVVLSCLYKCTDTTIGDTNVCVNIPVIKDAKVEEGVYGSSSKSYSYEDKAEIPTISYYMTSKTLDQALNNYKSSYNASTERMDIEGVSCGVAKEQNATINGETCNLVTYFVTASNGKVVAIEFREKTNAKTYAFGALSEGLHLK